MHETIEMLNTSASLVFYTVSDMGQVLYTKDKWAENKSLITHLRRSKVNKDFLGCSQNGSYRLDVMTIGELIKVEKIHFTHKVSNGASDKKP